MAYVSKELKAKLTPIIKAVLKKWDVKGTIAVKHYSKLVVTIRQAPATMNFTGKWHLQRSNCCAVLDKFYEELQAAIDTDNYDRSDVMTDYFDVGYYTGIDIAENLRASTKVAA